MPPQKSQKTRGHQGVSSSAPAFDGTRFVSLEATEAYAKGLRTKSLVAERGFNFKSFDLESIF